MAKVASGCCCSVDVARPKRTKQTELACRTSDVLGVHYYDTDSSPLVDSAALGSVVIARVSLKRIGGGTGCLVMGARQPLVNFYPQSCGPRKYLRPARTRRAMEG